APTGDGNVIRGGAYSAIEHLAKTAWCSPEWANGLMVMLTAAFDASGTDHDQPWLVCSGFIAHANIWIDFSNQWHARLGSQGPFHAAPLRHRLGDRAYENDPLVLDLLGLIWSHAQARFTSIVEIASFRGLSAEAKARFAFNAYVLAGRTCAQLVRHWALYS